MATKLQAIIDFVYSGGGVQKATADMGKLSNSINGVTKSATQMSIESAVLDARTSLLSDKMRELSSAVAKNKLTIEQAEEKYAAFENTLVSVPAKVEETETAFQGMKRGLNEAKDAWLAIATPIQSTIQTLQQVAAAAKQAYEFIGEGTQLAAAQDKFNALSSSIGETGDALLGKLKTATGGMVSDFELMEGATQLLNLGLTKTSEETVRLGTVAGKLGWDMNVLGLTIANQSTARLDSLGLSMEDVKARAEALRKQGMATDQAFKFAIIEAGEAKLQLLGDAADTAAGKLKILEANAQTLGDSFKATFSENLISDLNNMSNGLFESADGAASFGDKMGYLASSALTVGTNITTMRASIVGFIDTIKRLENSSKDAISPQMEKGFNETRDATIAATKAVDGWEASMNTVTHITAQAGRERAADLTATYQASDAYDELQDKITQTSTAYDVNIQNIRAANLANNQLAATLPSVTGGIYASAEAMKAFNASTGQAFMTAANAGDSLGFFNESLEDLGTHTVAVTTGLGKNTDDLELLQSAYDKAAQKVRKYQLGIEGANLSDEARAEKIAELQSQMANYQAQMDGLGGSVTSYTEKTIDATINQQAVNQALVDSIAAAGGSAAEIGAAALALGTMSEAQVEAAMKAAELEIRIAGVRQAYLDGRLSADELSGAIMQQIDIVNGMSTNVNDATGSVILMGDSMSTTAGNTQDLLDKLGAFPDEVSTSVNVDTGQAEAKVTNLYNKLRELGDPDLGGGGPSGGGANAGGGSTGGGYVAPGAAVGADYIVPSGYNENWYQPVSSGEHVQVTPAGQSRSGGDTYNLYVTAANPENVVSQYNYLKAIAGA